MKGLGFRVLGLGSMVEGDAGAYCESPPQRSQANLAHVRQSRPDSGFDFQVKLHKISSGVPFSRTVGIFFAYRGKIFFAYRGGIQIFQGVPFLSTVGKRLRCRGPDAGTACRDRVNARKRESERERVRVCVCVSVCVCVRVCM